MRRWIRGPEGRGPARARAWRRGSRDLLGEREEAREAPCRRAARRRRPAGRRLVRPHRAAGAARSARSGPVEAFLVAVLEQLRARAAPSELGMECAARPALDLVRAAARAAAAAPGAPSRRRCWPWRARWPTRSTRRPTTLNAGERARIEGALRGLDRRARMMLPAWRSMLDRHRRGRRGRSRLRRLVRRHLPATAGWSTPPAAATGSTRPSPSPPRCSRRPTACW